MKITLKIARLAFPELWTAEKVDDEGEAAFSANLIIPKNHPQVKEIRDAEEAVGKEKFGAKWPQVKKEITTNNRFALKDGDTKDYAGFANNLFISARNKTRPTVIDRDRSPLAESDGKPYAGCYVNAILELWAQDNKYGKRINASLSGIQFVKDGEPFSGGRPASADEFDDLGDQGDDEMADLVG